jgi:hypothetical protein
VHARRKGVRTEGLLAPRIRGVRDRQTVLVNGSAVQAKQQRIQIISA